MSDVYNKNVFSQFVFIKQMCGNKYR